MSEDLRCPVKDCTRSKPGQTYLTCKPCWKGVPRPLRDELWSAYKAVWSPKSGRWVARARKTLGQHEFSRRWEKFWKLRLRVIAAAYREPINKD